MENNDIINDYVEIKVCFDKENKDELFFTSEDSGILEFFSTQLQNTIKGNKNILVEYKLKVGDKLNFVPEKHLPPAIEEFQRRNPQAKKEYLQLFDKEYEISNVSIEFYPKFPNREMEMSKVVVKILIV
jgi:hypothetical protein